LYHLPTYLIAILLFIAMLGANSIGRRLGSRQDVDRSEGQTSQTNATLASILGLLALLLGFTFTMALQRFDARSEAVLQEANAIGTAYTGGAKWIYLLQARHGKETVGKNRVQKKIDFHDYQRLLSGYDLCEESPAWLAHERLGDSCGYFEAIWKRAV
jgi:hypothetical protein